MTDHNIELINIKDIKPYPNNPRVKSNISKVEKSIKEFGFLQPIVVDDNLEIVVGHSRYEASKNLNLEKVPVIVARNLSQAQIKAYRIADNKLNESSEWDYSALNKEITDLLDVNYELEDLGFDNHELEALITFNGNTDYYRAEDAFEEWNDMPEFKHENEKPYRTLYVHFYKEEEVQKFSKLINQPITEKTKFLYIPPLEKNVMKDKEYSNES
tara:strand:- start:320 stop:961 length:642 start_codon:yes stop_codon:yes gene_type:complete